MSAEQSSLFLEEPDAEPDPVPHIRSWPVIEQQKYCLARALWSERHDYCPAEVTNAAGVKTRITWDQWFERRFGQSLQQYQDHLKSKFGSKG